MFESKMFKEMIPRATLDPDGCITLTQVLQSFNAGVSEEQAWALCYQIIKTGQLLNQAEGFHGSLLLVSRTDHVKLHQDGSVHGNTFLFQNPAGPPRVHSSDECKIISKLVHVVYEALEYGMEDDAERVLSRELENFLEKMIYADETEDRHETDDEGIGIEHDNGDSDDDIGHGHRNGGNLQQQDSRIFNFHALLKVCRDRLEMVSSSSLVNHPHHHPPGSLRQHPPPPDQASCADQHYKAVIRALVAETLELSTFLAKVALGNDGLKMLKKGRLCSSSSHAEAIDGDPGLDGLHVTVWARLWVQVMRDLRNGVKLKKVEFENRGPPIEYELTPYEILMDDIRSRRWKLNKVMVDGDIPPRVKRDAHELILEFIRGRPPLRKAADRVLPPPPKKALPPIEALMESIRTQDPHSLRPTKTVVKTCIKKESLRNRPGHRPSSNNNSTNLSLSTTTPSRPTSNNHVVIENLSEQEPLSISSQPNSLNTPQRRIIKPDLEDLYKEDSDEDDRTVRAVSEKIPSGRVNSSTPSSGKICPVLPKLRRLETNEPLTLEITIPHPFNEPVPTINNENNDESSNEIPVRRHRSRTMSKSQLQEEFFQSNQWQTAMECLSLNLEEVVHIRNVLTKAELETLPVDSSTKEDVERGKLCFLCLKTRFGFFSWDRGSCCNLCKRTICTKCCSKMRIPTDQFANIPVTTLSPLLCPMREEDSSPCSTPSPIPSHFHVRRNSVDSSAPSSPSLSKSRFEESVSLSPTLETRDEDRMSSEGPYSLPSISLGFQALKNRSFGLKTKEESSRKDDPLSLSGQLMVVCHDCKMMVLEIIRSSSAQKLQDFNRSNNMNNNALDLPQLQTLTLA